MNRNLDLNLVRTFATVADHGSMTTAAHALFMTQGAISQQIKRLEALLGCSLFHRGPRRLALTHEGERLLVKARQLLHLNDEILAATAHTPTRQRLRIGAPPDLISRLPPALKTFSDANPQVELSVMCAPSPNLDAALNEGLLDIALIEYLADHAQGEVLQVEPLVWVASPGWEVCKQRPLPVSLVDERCVFRAPVLAALDKAGIAWRTTFENGSFEATASTVRAGLAVTAWLASTVPRDLQVLGEGAGLPGLPAFAVCLRMRAGVDGVEALGVGLRGLKLSFLSPPSANGRDAVQ